LKEEENNLDKKIPNWRKWYELLVGPSPEALPETKADWLTGTSPLTRSLSPKTSEANLSFLGQFGVPLMNATPQQRDQFLRMRTEASRPETVRIPTPQALALTYQSGTSAYQPRTPAPVEGKLIQPRTVKESLRSLVSEPRATVSSFLQPQGVISFRSAAGNNYQIPNVAPNFTSDDAIGLIQKYFPQQEWENARKVMMGESGGRWYAIGDDYPIRGEVRPSYGLFQIRHFANRGTKDQLLNPEYNVRKAAEMWKAQGWSPWTVSRKLGLIKPIKKKA